MKPDLEKIKRLLKESGMTQKQFAEKCNVTRVYLTQSLNGHKELSNKLLREIANALGTSVGDLVIPVSDYPSDAIEGETYIQCPCCKRIIYLSIRAVECEDAEDPLC